MQAMHLVYKALEKYAIPNVLPPELMPPGKRKDIVMPKPKSPVPVGVTSVTTTVSAHSSPPQPPPIPPLPNTIVRNLTRLDVDKIIKP